MIKSADHNSNYSDIATALTQSLATTGVSVMTGPFKAFPGTAGAPSITFNGSPASGFYLAGTNQIGWSSNGVLGATFNADTSVTFSGTISANIGTIPIGAVTDYAGATAPAGWLLCFGQLVSTTTYASLFSILSTTYGSGSGTFGIPDYRGRSGYGQDNMGGSAANRITVAGGNFDGTVRGGTGGGQSETLTLAQLPTGINVTGNVIVTSNAGNIAVGTISPFSNGTGVTFNAFVGAASSGTQTSQGTNTLTSNNTSGQLHTILSPAIITNKIIYAGV